MAYVALYRKYRSQSFNELMGQEQVTRTLQNAIKTGRIAHAYLFHGARGCGKTSTARLLARALNCVQTDQPNPEPCGVCRLCVSIRDGVCMDVLEMDAASETGIDDVREKIIENVQYAPAEARYKVYIIDEVHDLSAKAFDALLKTLEEPPPHVAFILATTEWHKVPITIRSRCQPFQFKRGGIQDLSKAIERVIQGEGYTAEPEAVLAIARSAEGSWRDALSLLEQVIAYSEGHLTAESVHRAIGTVGFETLAQVSETLATGKWDAALALAADLVGSGTDVRQLLTALSGHFRELLLIASGAEQAARGELGEERYNRLASQAQAFDVIALLGMLDMLSQAERDIRLTNQHRLLLERTFLRLMPEAREAVRASAPPPARAYMEPERAEYVAPAPRPAPRHEMNFDATPPPRQETKPPRPETQAVVTPSREAEPLPAEANRFAEEVTFEVVRRAWGRILKYFAKISPAGAVFLEKSEVMGLEGKMILLSFTESFARDRIQANEKGKAKVEQAINAVLNAQGYTIRCLLAGAEALEKKQTSTLEPETMRLMDTPQTTSKPETARIADFDVPNASPTVPDRVAETPPARQGFLDEVLEVFEGEIES